MRNSRRLAMTFIGVVVLGAGLVLGVVTALAQPRPIQSVHPQGSDVWAGSSISLQFERAVDRASVEAALTVEPAAQGRFRWQEDERVERVELLPDEPLAAETTYTVTLDTGARDAGGEPLLERPYSWSFTTRTDDNQLRFSYGLPVQLVTPSGGRGVPLQPGYPRVTLDLALYALDPASFAARYATLERNRVQPIDLEGLEQVASWSAHVDATEAAARAPLPDGTTPGLYVLDARHPRLGDAQTILVYSDYGMVAKAGTEAKALWVATVPDADPAAGAEVTLYEADGAALASATADADGVAALDPTAADAAFALAVVDGQTTLVGLDSAWASSGYYWWDVRGETTTGGRTVGHVHTDRPIYRPGHTVHYKATLRHVTRDGYSPLSATTPVTVAVRDGGGSTVVREALTPDRYGSVSGQLQVAEDAALGSWTIAVEADGTTVRGSFQVEEYVKPDFEVGLETDAPFYVRGDTAQITVGADYYFGEPVSGADVTLRLYRGYYYGRDEPERELHGTTDADGRWTATVQLDGDAGRSYTEYWYIEAEVVDASRRPVVAETRVPVHPAEFELRMTNRRYGVEAGQPVVLTATTMGHDGRPVTDRAVEVELRQYRRGGYAVLERRSVTTGADGTAEVRFADLEVGWYNVYATAADDRGNRLETYSYAWVFDGQRPWYWGGGLEVTADRDSYAPGETAQLLIRSPITTTALVTLERDDVLEELVVPVSGATTVEVPISADHAPNVWAKVHLWQPIDEPHNQAEGRLLTAMANLVVPATDKRLSVEVTPDAETHRPGEEATFTVRVTDAAGQPVDAQLSLAMVDKAVLALAADRSGDIFDAFWSPRSTTVATFDSLRPSQWYGAPERDAGGPPPGAPAPTATPGDEQAQEPAQPTPRREFPDTAYWNPALETGPDGEVVVTLTLPDTLTTWQVLARAITRDTAAGQGAGELTVTQPVQADPALPRFAVQGDHFALDLLARNYTGETLDGSCTLEAPGLVQLDPGQRTLELPTGETRFARWSVVAADVGQGTVTGRVTTDAGADAIELPLEVQPFAVPDRFVRAGSTTDAATEMFELPFNAVPEGSEVEVRLSPGLALGVLDGLEDLIGYPYGCVEQTMSRMLPNAVVGRLVQRLDIQAPEITSQLPELMSIGLQKLYGFQNEDGSWGWWHGDGNRYITAYVLHGLMLTEEAGYDVDDATMTRGLDWLAANIDRSPQDPRGEQDPTVDDPRIKAYAAYVLALGDRSDVELARGLYDQRTELDPFALAALALTLDAAGEPALAGDALDALVARAVETPTAVSWPMVEPDRWTWYHWRSMASTEKNTAMALEALVVLRPESPLAPKAARWLMEHRWGSGWRTTQATSFAVLALSDYIVESGELDARYDWTVRLDGAVVGEGAVTAANVTARIPPVVISGEALTPGQHTLTLEKAGDGTLFYTVVGQLALFYDGFEPTSAEGLGIRLSREYRPISGRSDADGWQTGDVLNVRLTVETDEDLHYVLIEDMLPAGFEALNERLDTESKRPLPGDEPWWRWWGYERKEIRDETVTFFSTWLRAGEHTFDYAVRAVTPGTFAARPAEAYAMYRPEVWGRSASDQVTVDTQRVAARPDLAGDFDRNCRLTEFDAALVAASWASGAGRDLSGDGRVSALDIGLATGRAGLACGDSVPLPPGPAGTLDLSLRVPDDVRAGQPFDLELVLEGDGPVGAIEATLSLPEGFEVLDATPGTWLADARALGPVVDGRTVRLGGYVPTDVALDGAAVVARLRLRAPDDRPGEIAVDGAQVVTARGAEYTVTADGTVVSPAPWQPLARVYLPAVSKRGE